MFFFFKQKTAYEMRISDWSSDVCSSDLVFGGETVEVRDADRSAFGGIFGIREYPASTTPTQFQSLLAVYFSFVLTQSFTFLGRAAESERFRLRLKKMEKAEVRAVSQMLDLLDAAEDRMSNSFPLGDHHLTLLVQSDDPQHLTSPT